MPRLPRARAEKHVAAFKRAGWALDRIEGSHYILVREDARLHLSIPVHKGKDLDVGLLKGLIRDADLTNEEYIDFFYRRKTKDNKE